MKETITRNLEDGADYCPDWRHQVVIEYLKSHANGGGKQSWEELLEEERDVVVRQVVRYHLDASCLIPEAVRYAMRCQQENGITGMASNIRAMILAGCTCNEIAGELKTSRRNILIFSRLYFDAMRYLDHDVWLESLLRRDFCAGDSGARTRERRLLRVAFNEGWTGLADAFCPRRPKTSENSQALANQVRYAVAARALEYVQDLDDSGVPASPEDFNRHLMVSSAEGRDLDKSDESGTEAKVRAWFMEAGQRGIFPVGLIKMGLGINESEAFEAGGRRRRRSLPMEDSTLDRVNSERAAPLGTDDQSEVPGQEMTFEP